MREIKFRAWYRGDIERGEPLLFKQKEARDELLFVFKEAQEFMYPFYIPFIDTDWIVEQYTGLKDKNGVEIYEGDLVKEYWQKEPSVIVYFADGYGFFDSYDNFHHLSITNELVSIVGNIHDKE